MLGPGARLKFRSGSICIGRVAWLMLQDDRSDPVSTARMAACILEKHGIGVCVERDMCAHLSLHLATLTWSTLRLTLSHACCLNHTWKDVATFETDKISAV